MAIKIVFDPVYTNKWMSRCATHYVLKKTALEILNRNADVYAYYLVPKNDKNFNVDDVPQHERLLAVPMDMYRDRYKEYFFLKREILDTFGFWGSHFDWDVWMTTRTASIPFIRFMSEKTPEVFKRKVVIFEALPMFSFKATIGVNPRTELQVLSGYLNSDLIAVNTQWEVDEIIDAARRMLSPYLIKELMKKLKVKYVAPITDYEYPLKRSPKIEGKFRVGYIQRLDASERQPEVAFDSFFYSFVPADSEKIEFDVYTNSSGEGTRRMMNGKYRFITVSYSKREEFWERLKKLHVFVSSSREEGMPLSLFEAIVKGVIGVVLRKKWSIDMFGKDYPWLVGNVAEIVTAVNWIRDNYERAYSMFLEWYKKSFLPKVKERGDFIEFIDGMIKKWEDDLREFYNKNVDESSQKLSRIIDQYCKENAIEKFDIFDVCQELYNKGLTVGDLKKRVMERDFFHVPHYRNMSLYETICQLKFWFGWKNDLKPGRLRR